MSDCPVCGKEIPPRTHGGGSPKLFCSEKCRKKQAEARRYQKHRERMMAVSKNYYWENRDTSLAKSRKWNAENSEACAAAARKYRAAHPGAQAEAVKKWREKYPERYFARLIKRRKSCIPPWLTAEQQLEIRRIYAEARALTESTGIQHEVDHIEPICGKDRSGLHVPWNLQILTADENRSKGNRVADAA